MSPEKLSLALEPESAAVHCQRKAKVASKGSQYMVRANSYLVVDIGGSTADIALHHIVGDHVEEIVPPAFNFWGGTSVNEEFSKFLQDFVDDPHFSRYIKNGSPEVQLRHKADLNVLLYTTFETQKRLFGSGRLQDSYIVEFPYSFLKVYQDILVRTGMALNSMGGIIGEVEDDGAVMRIYEKKMADFFQPAVDGITNLIESYLQGNEIELQRPETSFYLPSKIAHTVDTIYWVGGFGGCEYLRYQLESVINRGHKYCFAVPPQPELAVILGATVVQCDPSIVLRRKAGASSGVLYNQAQGENLLLLGK